MSSVPDPTKEVVRLARLLERLIAKKRRVLKQYQLVDAEVVQTRKFLQELTRPFAPAPVLVVPCHCGGDATGHEFRDAIACVAGREASS